MRSRRDQLQAYQFLRRRIVAALLSGEPDSPEAPMRRIVRTAFAGIMIAVMIGAVFGVVGVLKKGGATSWQKGDIIVIDKESAAVYVWVAKDPKSPRQLHPMVNLTSARLFLGSDTRKSLSGKSLAGIRRQPLLGIRDAPVSVPNPKDLIRGPWTVCARTGGAQPEVTLLAGVTPPGARLGVEDAALVSAAPGSDVFVVWKGQRFKTPEQGVRTALGFSSVKPTVVGAAWVNALPEGKPLTFPHIPDRGRGINVLGKPTHVGQVFTVTGAGTVQYAVALGYGAAPAGGQGLAVITQGVANLILADPQAATTRTDKDDLVLTLGQLAAAEKADRPADFDRYPAAPLRPAVGLVQCTSASGSSGPASPLAVYTGGELPTGGVSLSNQDSSGRALADKVYLRGGASAMVRGQDGSKTIYLLTDAGKKFPIAGDDSLKALGLDTARPASVPAEFLRLLPDGPSLSREAAAKPAA